MGTSESSLGGDVDWAEALRAVRGSRPLLATVVEAALTEVPSLMRSISEALARHDAAGVRLSAHTLKGSVRCFGETPSYDLAFQIETAARDGRLDDVPAILPRLETEIARFTAALAGYRP